MTVQSVLCNTNKQKINIVVKSKKTGETEIEKKSKISIEIEISKIRGGMEKERAQALL